MNRFRCRCLFDITATGVTGHLKSSRMPFRDRAGNQINDSRDWNRARNQQRNWETLTQLISLRTQIIDVTEPVKIDGAWEFEFGSDTTDVYGTAQDPTLVLRNDCIGVPMIINLEDSNIMSAELVTQGTDQNIWFDPVSINNQ
jgi:hypothetical protein